VILFHDLEYISDPAQVIGLLPGLLPEDYRKQLRYPSEPPVLNRRELEKGFSALITFLTQVCVADLTLLLDSEGFLN